MAGPAVIQITEPGGQARRITVDRSVEVGSDCDGEVIADPSVSARHLKLVASPVALSLVDLGSSGGTFVNGQQAEGRIVLVAGDVVRSGGTEIEVISSPGAAQDRPDPGAAGARPAA